ncbi:hypothetical protein KP509_01G118800 [Ceratopteris richardii]|uniref:BHLH domain-containing protein n=1 Tax=Ceratopteris richardii TaxID=49495 RepID=A0A8T2VTK6_CERRI|nr:hypothetical protein KP509_01G118800 [Ceratopteris richardii]
MSASPKRMKTVHLSAEATSSSEMVATADERDGADNLKQMRKDGMSQREVHILSERQRRKSMRESFSILQSLVPKLKLKHTDRITVLTEVITYIQSLRGALDELERKKADMMEFLGLSGKHRSRRQEDDLQATVTYIDPGNNLDDKDGELVAMVEVTVRMCGPDVFLTLNAPQRRGVWSGVLSLLQKFSIEVSNATLASSGNSSFHCIHAKAMDVSTLKGVNLQEELERVIVKELGRQSKRHRN